MNRILTTIIALWSMCTMAGLPPTTLSGEQATTKPTTFTFETPNYQATQVSGIKSRIETGNTNLLVNPSFEHATFNMGWTNGSGTVSADTTYRTDGKKAMKILSSSIGTDIYQTSTLNAANLKGQQMVASADVNTNDPLTQACAIVDGVDTNCVTVPVTSTAIPFRNVVIPFIAGGTNNGIRLKSATTTSGLITYLDNVRVGQGLPLQNVSGAKLVGTVTITGCASAWGTSSAALATLGTVTGCTYTTTGSISAPSTMIAGFQLSQSVGPGVIQIHQRGNIYESGTAGSVGGDLALYDGTTTSTPSVMASYGAAGQNASAQSSISASFQYATAIPSGTTYQIKLAAKGGSTVYANATGTQTITFEVYYFPPESKIYSQASQDYDWTSYTPTFTGFGTVTNVGIWHKRDGSDLLIKGNFTTGTLTTVTPQFTLPSGLTIDTSKVPSAVSVCSVSQRGISAATGSQYTNYIAINPSTPTVIKFATGNNSLTGTNEITNTTLSFGNSEVQSFAVCRIPIQGWQDYGVIVGSFANVPTVTGLPIPKLFGATITTTAGTLSNNMGSVFSSCTAANPTVCTLTGLTAAPNCSILNQTSTTELISNNGTAPTSSSITLGSYNSTTGAAVASQTFSILCLGY